MGGRRRGPRSDRHEAGQVVERPIERGDRLAAGGAGGRRDEVIGEVSVAARGGVGGLTDDCRVSNGELAERQQLDDRLRDVGAVEASGPPEDPRQLAEDDVGDVERLTGGGCPFYEGGCPARLVRVVSQNDSEQDVGVEADHRLSPRRTLSTAASWIASSISSMVTGVVRRDRSFMKPM